PFNAIVCAAVGFHTVAVIFTIGLVVLCGVADRVAQGEAVVAGHEVNTGSGPFSRALKQVGTAAEPAGEEAGHAAIATPESAYIVAKPPVPLRPGAFGKVTQEIGAAGVPSLGDQLGFAQDGILGDLFEKRGIGKNRAVAVAPQHRSQVKAESVDV